MLAPGGAALQAVPKKQDKNTFGFLSEMARSGANIAGDEMGCLRFDCGKQNRNILIGHLILGHQVSRSSGFMLLDIKRDLDGGKVGLLNFASRGPVKETWLPLADFPASGLLQLLTVAQNLISQIMREAAGAI